MLKPRIAIVGYGNIGRYALKALQAAPDMEVAGVVSRSPSELEVPAVRDVAELGRVDAAILSLPSRMIQGIAPKYLEAGISTVDSFDIHSQIPLLRRTLSPIALKYGVVSVVAAGWDPGTDSVVRTMMQAICPEGETWTNFGPGRSMGHTVAARAIEGVRDALSLTLPLSKGRHARKVYVEMEPGFPFDAVAAAVKSDPYFASDPTEVVEVDSVAEFQTLGHGVDLVREGSCSQVPGQSLDFRMRINNPALTGQVLVCAARAALRQKPGCYTLPEIPVIDLLAGSREDAIAGLC